MGFNRRDLFKALSVAGIAPLASSLMAQEATNKKTWPKKPVIPTDFNAQEFFKELQAKGKGVVIAGTKSPWVAYMVFDTQCPWCQWEFEQLKPFFGRVNFVWYPVAVLSPWSELQGAAILESKDPQATLEAHFAHFKDAEFKGLDVRKMTPDFAMREAVFNNSKVYRRAGGRSVPFGVLKTPSGRYIPIAEQNAEKFEALLKSAS